MIIPMHIAQHFPGLVWKFQHNEDEYTILKDKLFKLQSRPTFDINIHECKHFISCDIVVINTSVLPKIIRYL